MTQQKIKKYLKLWGFKETDYESTYQQLGLSPNIIKHIEKYITNFPSPRGLAFIGNAKVTTKTMGRTVKLLLDQNKFKNRVSIVDIPSYLLRINTLDFQERSSMEAKMEEDLVNSDLVILQEVGLTRWNDFQQTKLYTIIHERYSRERPVFVTVSCDVDDLEKSIGNSNFFRIEDSCDFLEL